MVGSEKANVLPIRPYIFKKSLDFIKNPSLFEPFRAFHSPRRFFQEAKDFLQPQCGTLLRRNFFFVLAKKKAGRFGGG